MRLTHIYKTIVGLAFFAASTISSAAIIPLGVISNNDSKETVIALIGTNEVFPVAKIEAVANYDGSEITADGFSATGTSRTTGDWHYDGNRSIDWLVIKYGRNYGIYEITDGDLSGSWDIAELESALSNDASGAKFRKDGSVHYSGFKHAALYSSSLSTAVPVPAAGWLFLSGLIGLVAVSRRQHH